MIPEVMKVDRFGLNSTTRFKPKPRFQEKQLVCEIRALTEGVCYSHAHCHRGDGIGGELKCQIVKREE